MNNLPTRAVAWELLSQYVTTESLQRHARTVEAVMRHFARQYQEDENEWGMIGLLHDLDFERWPDQHCYKVREVLAEYGFSPEFIRAVASHGYGICSEIEPQSNAEKVIYTIDELTGLISACALMRPSKSVLDLEVSSVKKKFKSPAFAANVNRQVILDGCNRLGKELDEVIRETIAAMCEIAPEIGLGMRDEQ